MPLSWAHRGWAGHTPSVPVLTVSRGEFLDSVELRGRVKARKSVEISAPAETADLQILKLATDGSLVKQGDVIVEFDRSRAGQDLVQFRSALKAAQAEIEQGRAQARLTAEEDTNAVLKAGYEVESARLDASKAEIVSEIEGAEAKLKLADAQQKLREAQQKLKANQRSSAATVQGKIDAARKAAYDVERTERGLSKMSLKAPLSGMVSLSRSWSMQGETTFKPGDHSWPGAPIAEIPDISTLRIFARADETERGRLALQQPVTVHLDAVADRQFTGKLESIGTLTSMDLNDGWPFPRKFDLGISIDQSDPRLKPEMTAQVTVIVERVPNAITVPAQATFQKSGHSVAYVWNGSAFQERSIEIGRRNGDRILVASGLHPGDRVALRDPAEKE